MNWVKLLTHGYWLYESGAQEGDVRLYRFFGLKLMIYPGLCIIEDSSLS